ncbi:MAG: glycosyltransferase [Holophagales bacterium]|nr:glycosyltransferase [Holophagales bacterium]
MERGLPPSRRAVPRRRVRRATPVLAGPALAAWLSVPLVTLLRGNDFDTGLFSLRRGWALRDALARSAAVATVSRDHLRKVSALYPAADVRFIPNGIDPAEWSLVLTTSSGPRDGGPIT